MSRSKKMFAWAALLFLCVLFYASYDIARRTTFPGKKPQLKTRIQDAWFSRDSVNTGKFRVDSLPRKKNP